MAHGDAREGKWRGNWRTEWVASTLHTTSQHGVSSITTADAHTSAVSSRLNWRPRRFKWTRPFRRKTKSGFCACAITFQTQSTPNESLRHLPRWRSVHSLLNSDSTCYMQMKEFKDWGKTPTTPLFTIDERYSKWKLSKGKLLNRGPRGGCLLWDPHKTHKYNGWPERRTVEC